MINKELLEEWVSALRSNKYEQGKGRLRTQDDKYCCLGVLCHIAKEDIGGSWELVNEKYSFVVEDNEHSAYLPYKMELIEEAYLTEMNDRGYSFDKIADYIEENILSNYE